MRDDRGREVKARKRIAARRYWSSGVVVSLLILAIPAMVVSAVLANNVLNGLVIFVVIFLVLLVFNIGVTPGQVRLTLYGTKDFGKLVVRCAACDYPLYSVPRGADGFVNCPECGAAWKLESTDA